MAKLGRPELSDAKKRELWDRWAAEDSISEIRRAMGKPPGSVLQRTPSSLMCPGRKYSTV